MFAVEMNEHTVIVLGIGKQWQHLKRRAQTNID